MKPGEPPPRGVKGHILKLAGRDPRPTNKAIQENVEEKFGVKVDEHTIVRYCKRAGLPSSTQKRQDAEETSDVGQEFRVWCGREEFAYVRVVSKEYISPSGRSVVDFGPLDAEAEVTRRAADALGIEPGVLARLKIEVLEDVAVRLVELNTESSTSGRGLSHEVDAFTPSTGPGAEGTWFWLYGKNKELSIRVRNPTGYRTPISRVRFSGWRTVTEPVNRPRGSVIEAVSRGWT